MGRDRESVDPTLRREVLDWLDSGSYSRRALVRNIAKTTSFTRDDVRTALDTLAGTGLVDYYPDSGLYRRPDRR
jgi:DNA-binding IclR family transcriptional regulator